MKEKLYDPARQNEKAPEKGMAAVNTNNEEEEKTPGTTHDQPLPGKEEEEGIKQKED